MITSIRNYCDSLIEEFDTISLQRKNVLQKIADYITEKHRRHQPVNLVYICTHNSRRSHFGQVWAKVASDYFSIPNVHTYSGGTEATAFNINAINALKRIGFIVKNITNDENRIHHVLFGEEALPVVCFSKKYDNIENPKSQFAAIMTCSDAEDNCPVVSGAELRVSTTYDDPKAFDKTPRQDKEYDERCRQIAREIFYIFSVTKTTMMEGKNQ